MSDDATDTGSDHDDTDTAAGPEADRDPDETDDESTTQAAVTARTAETGNATAPAEDTTVQVPVIDAAAGEDATDPAVPGQLPLTADLVAATRPVRLLWLHWFVALTLLGGAWVLASPPFSGPDEPAHVTRAASLWSGHLVGTPAPEEGEGRSIVEDVPDPLIHGGAVAGCFAFVPEEPACDDDVDGDDRLVDVVSTAGRYPPLYYALVGGPLRAWPSANGIFLSRFLGVLLAAAAIASAAALAQRRGPAPATALGVVVAATPMALFSAAVINPSGLEIATAVLLWIACLQLAAHGPDRPTLVALAISGAVLAQSRPLSPLFVALAGVTVVLAFGRGPLMGLLRCAGGLVAVAALVLSSALMWWWVVAHEALELVPGAHLAPDVDGFGEALGETLQRVPVNLEQMIGAFGWLDVEAPAIVMATWLAAVAVLAVAALRDGRGRALWSLAGLLLAVAVLPPLLEARSYDDLGFVWQGRYTLPLAVGVPLLAGHIVDHGRPPLALARRQIAVVAAVLAFMHLLAFWWALRRYVTGIEGPVIPDIDEPWAPPIHAINLCLIAACAAALLAWAASRTHRAAA